MRTKTTTRNKSVKNLSSERKLRKNSSPKEKSSVEKASVGRFSEKKSSENSFSDLRARLMWLCIPASAVLLAVLLNSFVIISAIVPSESMADTIEKGSLIVASRLAYKSHDAERGDIILFVHPDIDEPYLVKRVIALPGDTVEIRDGYVYLNGDSSPLDETYVSSSSDDDLECITVPEDCYFVLGDNRCHSTDSRSEDFGFVWRENIRARAVITLLPKIKTL